MFLLLRVREVGFTRPPSLLSVVGVGCAGGRLCVNIAVFLDPPEVMGGSSDLPTPWVSFQDFHGS